MATTERVALENRIAFLKRWRTDLDSRLEAAEAELANLQQGFVQVVYLDRGYEPESVEDLARRPSWDYIDATDDGLRVGDRVIAPRFFSAPKPAIVVALGRGQSQTYDGPWCSITHVESRCSC